MWTASYLGSLLSILHLSSCLWALVRLLPAAAMGSKARKGNVGSSVEWRLNSENDSRLHGQPSIAGAAGHVGSWAFYPQLYTSWSSPAQGSLIGYPKEVSKGELSFPWNLLLYGYKTIIPSPAGDSVLLLGPVTRLVSKLSREDRTK
jgi:hypothetical protein